MSGKRREDRGACAFCRTPPTEADEEVIDRLNKGVERNDAKSMEMLAIYFKNGEFGLQQDLAKAMKLFQKAGEHGCASAYGWLGNIYSEGFTCDGLQTDNKKSKHYLELAALGGDMDSRYNLAIFDGRNGNKRRASKHLLICAKHGFEPSLHQFKLSFHNDFITKDEYTEALRAYYKQHDDRKSAMRDEAFLFLYGDDRLQTTTMS